MTQSPHAQTTTRGHAEQTPYGRHVRAIAIALIPLGVVALGAWFWLGQRGTPRPIAHMQTQDFHALVWSPTEPDAVFFGHHDGMLKSLDGGHSWQTTPLVGADAMNLAVSPMAPERMYAAGHGVFLRSDDGGATWTAPQTRVQGADLHGFAQNPTDPDQLFTVDVKEGLLASIDGGDSWTAVTPTPPGQAIAFSADGTTLLSTAADGVQQSTDGGVTWESSGTGLPQDGQVITLATTADGSMFAGTTKGLYRRNGPATDWQATALPVPILAIAASPVQPQLVLAIDQQGRVFRSDTGGVSW